MRVVVARVEDFPPGARRIVKAGARSIGVFRAGDRFYALRNRCPHQGGPLCEGVVQPWVDSPAPGEVRVREGRYRVACPWHDWEYDLETGSRSGTARLTRAAVPRVGRPGEQLTCASPREVPEGARAAGATGPYTAEIFPVVVERGPRGPGTA